MAGMSIQKRAEEFVKRWQALPGDEDGETQKFWIELLGDVFQVPQPTKLLKFERHVMRRRIDVLCQDRGVLIEHKSRGIDLDKPRDNGQYGYETPYQQAKWYVTYLTKDERPDYIITCNFDEIRIYNEHIEGNVCIKMRLEELPIHYQLLLNIFTSDKYSRVVKEKELSFEAGKIVGRLYNALSQRYLNIETSEDEQKSLNILIVRFVFLLYAEDSGVMQTDVFCRFLQNVPTANLRQEFAVLFRTLNTPEHERSLYLRDDLKAFPYVNGGLFAKVGIDPETDIVIPQFTPEIHRVLFEEASQGVYWALVNPSIFGAVCESTLNPESRRAGGMHYTSTENILKVIDPLFLDELTAELERIEALKSASEQVIACKKFQKRLSSLRVLDPACGSGNFLTETYLSLRKLENRALALMLAGKQASFDFGDESSPIQVRITQFYGIEINDFAVEVARTAMWIAQSQMAAETSGIVEQALHVLPLTSIPGIVEGSALRMDWNEVLPASECTHIIGNPPFLGHQLRSKLQQEDMDIAYQKQGKYGKLDYVCAWYRKAIQYIGARPIRFAFVSTNSICQGESVRTMWEPIFNAGFEIDFAWPTFIWNSESVEVAHVHVVIIGLSGQKFAMKQKLLFKEGDIHNATHINGYLIEAPDVFIENRGKPCNPGAPEMTKGSQPTDGGH